MPRSALRSARTRLPSISRLSSMNSDLTSVCRHLSEPPLKRATSRWRGSCQEPPNRCVELIARFLAEPMASALDNFISARPDTIDSTRARCKNPAVEDGVTAAPGKRGMRGVEGHDVGARTWLYSDGRLRKRPGASGERPIEQGAAGRDARNARKNTAGQHVALAVLQTLTIFELTQFVCNADQDVGVRADAEPAAGLTKFAGRKNAV